MPMVRLSARGNKLYSPLDARARGSRGLAGTPHRRNDVQLLTIEAYEWVPRLSPYQPSKARGSFKPRRQVIGLDGRGVRILRTSRWIASLDRLTLCHTSDLR
jgi:hypothetical protein